MGNHFSRWFVARWTLPVVMVVMTASVANAQRASAANAQRAHVGARFGYDYDVKIPLVSTQVTVPVTRTVEFYPSVDIYLPDQGSMMGFNGDVKFNMPTNHPRMYVGTGLGVQTRTLRRSSTTDVGINALFGVETRAGWVHPFVEGRGFISETNRVSIMAGLNFTIGGR